VLGRHHRARLCARAGAVLDRRCRTFAMGLGTAITVAAIASIAVGARGFAGRLAKSKPGAGLIMVRGLETAAALAIIAFGVLLLTGYIVSERMVGG
jgi:nickel/cobalt transporter (NicO) family protein